MNVDWFELGYSVIGGLCVFLFGMKALSESLQALASDFLRRVIGWLTTNRLLAILVGTITTVIIQSSTVTTVMVVGFVNAGLMSLTQAVGVILGANIGTTVTGWIVALKIGKYGLVFLALGLAPFFFLKNVLWKNLGKISIALGFIFLGLEFMSNGFKPLTAAPDFAKTLTFFDAKSFISVLACVVVGCLLTCIVQSSSAMLGITIALATTAAPGGEPVISLATAVALVLGENIGTTITAQLAAIGGTLAAKRAAMAHTLFNTAGVFVMVVIFQPFMGFVNGVIGPAFDSFSGFFQFNSVDDRFAVRGFEIAAAHSLFNVTNVILFSPFIPQLAKVTEWLRPDTKDGPKNRLKLLGDISQISPELALTQATRELEVAFRVTDKLLRESTSLFAAQGDLTEQKQAIDHAEEITDNIQKEVTVFLTTVLQMVITPEQASRAYGLIRIADEVESVADYCQSLGNYAVRLAQNKQHLSVQAREEFEALVRGTQTLFKQACDSIAHDHASSALGPVSDAAETLKEQANRVRDAHLTRVKNGDCDALTGLVYSDMIVALRRIKNHTVNMVEAGAATWDIPNAAPDAA